MNSHAGESDRYSIMRGLVILALVFAASLAPSQRLNCQSISAPTSYVWERAVETGRGCFEYQNCPDGRWPMAIRPLAVGDTLYAIGQSSIWTTSDGMAWKRTAKTDWGERYGMTFVHFAGKFWMTGGMSSWDKFHNDVWYSTDGIDWKLAGPALWAARRNHSLVVFDGKLWLIGGAESSGRADQTPSRFHNDVWSSRDGIKWTVATRRAPWIGRDNQHAFAFDNKLWLIAGTGQSDVWSSRDGKDWVLVNGTAPWDGRHGAGSLVFDNKIWVFGGLDRNDVWSSADGKTWLQVFGPAPWSTRGAENSVVFNNALWIFAGKTGRSDSWQESGDVWKMRPIQGTSITQRRRIDVNVSSFWYFLFFLLR